MLEEKQIINAVEEYLKLTCHEFYKNKNLGDVFKKARDDDKLKLEMLKIINKFIFE